MKIKRNKTFKLKLENAKRKTNEKKEPVKVDDFEAKMLEVAR